MNGLGVLARMLTTLPRVLMDESGGMTAGGQSFFPVVANYRIGISYDCNNSEFFISPHWNYSDLTPSTTGEYPSSGCAWRHYFSSTDEVGVAYSKLASDFQTMKNRGFNTVRLMDLNPKWDENIDEFLYPGYSVFEESYGLQEYLPLLDQILDLADLNDLYVILTLSPTTEIVLDTDYYQSRNEYRELLKSISSHVSSRTEILAIDLYNEPYWDLAYSIDENLKYEFSNWCADWYYTVKHEAPNTLVTIGITYIESATRCGQESITADFLSSHIYTYTDDIQESRRILLDALRYNYETYNMPWIISETGFSGTDVDPTLIHDPHNRIGSEQDQLDYAEFMLDIADDCGCSGSGWWALNNVNWGGFNSEYGHYERYFGLQKTFNETNESEESKLAFSAFESYAIDPNPAACSKQQSYHNTFNFNDPVIQSEGYVIDNETGLGIENATVQVWGGGWNRGLTNTNGYYNIRYGNDGSEPPLPNLSHRQISAPGYETVTEENENPSPFVVELRRIVHNDWEKRYSNRQNGKFEDWELDQTDRYYKGDFDGDGDDEMFFCQNSGNNDILALFEFSNGKWFKVWEGGNSESIFPYRHTLYPGDFDGDGKDEILGFNSWITSFSWNGSGWIWETSSYGNPNYPLEPYRDEIRIGDFDGDGADEVLGLCIDNSFGATYVNSTALFKFQTDFVETWNDRLKRKIIPKFISNSYTGRFVESFSDTDLLLSHNTVEFRMFLFSSFLNDWLVYWSAPSSHAMWPYRNKLIIGDFDIDPTDEILGLNSWGTKFDFEQNDFNWSWSTYQDATFSDFKVDPDASTFFFRAYEHVPDYLSVVDWDEQDGVLFGQYAFEGIKHSAFPGYTGISTGRERLASQGLEKAFNKQSINKNTLRLFPVPTSHELTITFNTNNPNLPKSNKQEIAERKYYIRIFDSQGRVVFHLTPSLSKSGNISIDISSLMNGVYTIALMSDEYFETGQFIVSK